MPKLVAKFPATLPLQAARRGTHSVYTFYAHFCVHNRHTHRGRPDIRFLHRFPQIPVHYESTAAIEHAAQVVKRACKIDGITSSRMGQRKLATRAGNIPIFVDQFSGIMLTVLAMLFRCSRPE